MTSTKNLLRIAVLAVTFAVSGAIIAGFFGRAHPALDSFAHFRAHLGVMLVFCAVLLLVARFRWNAAVAVLFGLAAIVSTLPASTLRSGTAQAASPAPTPPATYTLLQLNLRWNHPNPDRVLAFIQRERPDVITVDEVSPMWADKLASIRDTYPYQHLCDVPYYGTAVISRLPFAEDPKGRCFGPGALAIASVDFDGTAVDIGAIHLEWPWPYAQPKQIDRLKAALGTLAETSILAGDLNATTWSAATARVIEAGRLSMVEGVGPTWLDYTFARGMRLAGLPIDHVMVKGAVTAQKAEVLQDVGSDHWPVLMEFSVNQPGA